MYDEKQIEDSLEFCRRAQDLYEADKPKKKDDELTAEDLFSDMANAMHGIGSKKPWEKILDELDNNKVQMEVEVQPEVKEEPKVEIEVKSEKKDDSGINNGLLGEEEPVAEELKREKKKKKKRDDSGINYGLLGEDKPETEDEIKSEEEKKQENEKEGDTGINHGLLDSTEPEKTDEDHDKDNDKKSILSKEEIEDIFQNEVSKFRKESYQKHKDSLKKEHKADKAKLKKDKEEKKKKSKKANTDIIRSISDSLQDFSIKMANRKSVNKMIMTNNTESSGFSLESSSFKLISNIIIVVLCIGIAFGAASLVNNYVIDQTTVEGESMQPTLNNGDSVVIQKLSYMFSNPQRYDIVVFPVAYDDTTNKETYYIKRIIGLPGETIQIIDGKVNINGNALSDDKFADIDISDPGLAANPITLGTDEYFVLGDNRNESTDSRSNYVGIVKKRKIVGRASYRIWPLSDMGKLSD